MTISPASKESYASVINLLTTANLPVEDIGDNTELYQLKNDQETIGSIGLEYKGEVGLLRSLGVAESSRGKGYGEQLVQFLEETAKEKGVSTLYLLTTTAASFFAKRGYVTISREEVPSFIRQSSEFSSTCPASATIMKKRLV